MDTVPDPAQDADIDELLALLRTKSFLSWRSRTGVVALLLAVTCCFLSPLAAAPARGLDTLPARPLCFGYVNWLRSGLAPSQEIANLDYAAADAVILGFAEPRTDGSLGFTLGDFATYRPLLVSNAHVHARSCLMGIGGAAPASLPATFATIASDASRRAAFAGHIVAALDGLGFDGVDIDYEFPQNTTQRAQFTLLMRDVFQRVKAANPNYIVMFGVSPGYYLDHYDWAQLGAWTDFAFYFGYDWKNPANGPLTQPGSVQYLSGGFERIEASCRGALHYLLASGFPANKIILGLPFYSSGNESWLNVRDTWLAARSTYRAQIHPDFLEVQMAGSWWNTPDSIPRKLSAVLDPAQSVLTNRATLRGVGFWEFGHQAAAHPDLSNAIRAWLAANTCGSTNHLPALKIERGAGDQYRFWFPETNGCSFVVESTDDLLQWQPVRTNTSMGGIFEYTASVINGVKRFHRVRRN